MIIMPGIMRARSTFSPASQFAGGTNGFWIENGEVYSDTGFGVKIAPGNAVPVFRDLSGNGNHITQATVAKQAPLATDANGLLVVEPDGSDDAYASLGSINFGAATQLSYLVALRQDVQTPLGVVLEQSVDLNAAGNSSVRMIHTNNDGTNGNNRFGFKTGSYAIGNINSPLNVPRTTVFAVTVNLNGATIQDRLKVVRNGVALTGADISWLISDGAGGISFANLPFYLFGRAATSFYANVGLFGSAVIGRALSDAEILSATNLMLRRTMNRQLVSGLIYGANLGDSTIVAYSGTNDVADYTDTFQTKQTIAVAGHTIAQQDAAWTAYGNKSSTKWAVIQVGLNDLDPVAEPLAAPALARYQTLVNNVRAGLPGAAKLFVATMTPVRARLITLYGGTNGPIAYQKWLDMNAAISGSGPNAITNVDGRITSHTATLNDGSGNLAGAYDTGDGVHENNAGRAIIGAAWQLALQTGGAL